MPSSGGKFDKQAVILFGLLFVCWVVSGCTHATNTNQPTEPEPAAVTSPCPPDRTAELKRRNEMLESSLQSGIEKNLKLEQDIANMKLQVLGYEALIGDLRRRSDILQKRLDAAIVEVVRTKSKLRSLESKAEAASTLAEAEIAVKALKKRGATANEVILDEISIADQLLTMSIDEFKARNFGGALYLANQAKGQVRTIQERLDKKSETTAAEGESLFAQPLNLKVIKDDCNLREGPGLNFQVVGSLNSGDAVVAFSFKGSWVRVETKEGLSGWIFQSLVGVP